MERPTKTPPLVQSEPILHAQIKACCRKHYEIFVSAVLAIAFVVFLSLDKGENPALYVWISVTTAILACRFGFILYFNRLQDEHVERYHIQVFTTIMWVWGMAWGLGTAVFFPLLSMPQQAAWFAMFMVMVAASASSHAVYLRAFYAFALPYFIGMVWMVATQYPSPWHINAVIVTLVMITQVGAAKKGNEVMMTSLRLGFDNLSLVEKLKVQKRQAENANLAKSKFLAAASHDLRQPLHALTLFSCALQEALDDREKATQLVHQINGSIQALQELFNALLDISRLDAGTLVCEKMHFNSRQLTDKLANDFTPLAHKKNLSLSLDLMPTALYSDPTLLGLILQNLLSNALRYTHKGGVTLRLVPKGRRVCIDVIDTGIGIAPERQQQIFDEFVQLDNPERDRSKGLGLGLAIVKRVARLLDCDISLSSEPGKGSMFSVSVEAGNPDAIPTPPTGETSSHNDRQQSVVLVIDDEKAVLDAMQALIGGWGYRVVAVQSLEAALEVLQEADLAPDGIIADLRLKDGQTGIDAITALRRRYGDRLPALVVSGDIAKERLQEVQHSGLEMLHKPVQPARLRAFLQTQL